MQNLPWCALILCCVLQEFLVNTSLAQEDGDEGVHSLKLKILEVRGWLESNIRIGAVGGIATGKDGSIYVFHRHDRVWDRNSFYTNDTFAEKWRGPITVPTILAFNPLSGNLVHSGGRARFYLPHGVTVDNKDNVWVTDVALHQVFKFPPLSSDNADNPLMTLGTAFYPGNDHGLFCKPTSVAVLNNGDFFVADGYCNNRVIKFSQDGEHLEEFGRSSLITGMFAPYFFDIPHGLAVAEDKNLLFVADRQNGRVQVFDIYSCSFIYEIADPSIFGKLIYDVAYSPANGGLLYLINGPHPFDKYPIQGFVVDISGEDHKVVADFHPAEQYFTFPHSLTVSEDGREIYVGELDPMVVWKLSVDGLKPLHLNASAESLQKISQSSDHHLRKEKGSAALAIIIAVFVFLFGILLVSAVIMYTKRRRSVSRGRPFSLEEDLMLEPR